MDEIDDFASPLGDDSGSVWLNDLFSRAQLPGTSEELSAESAVVDAMVRTIAQPLLISDLTARRRRGVSKTATRTAIVAAVLLVGTSTAAATGNLPDAAQSAVSRASSHFGVDIPDPYDERGTDQPDASAPTTESPTTTATTSTVVDDPAAATETGTSTPTGPSSEPSPAAPGAPPAPDGQQPGPPGPATPGPDVNGPAKRGLCQAWAAHGPDSPANEHSTAMKKLQAAATAAGQTVAEFCADAPAPGSPGAATTPAPPTPPTDVAGPGNNNDNKDPGEDPKDKDKDKDKKDKDTKDTKPKPNG